MPLEGTSIHLAGELLMEVFGESLMLRWGTVFASIVTELVETRRPARR